jgi:hypothetical protein
MRRDQEGRTIFKPLKERYGKTDESQDENRCFQHGMVVGTFPIRLEIFYES